MSSSNTSTRKAGSKYLSEETYDALVVAFIERPDNYAHAARKAGTTERTARKAYEKGWPKLNRPAIRIRVQQEMVRARAQAEAEALAKRKQREQEAHAAQENASKELKDELMLAQLSRAENVALRQMLFKPTLNLAKSAAELLEQFAILDQKATRAWMDYEIKEIAGDPTAVKPTFPKPKLYGTEAMIRVVHSLTQLKNSQQTNERQQAEYARLLAGKPMGHFHVGISVDEPVTEKEYLQTLESIKADIERVQRTSGEVNGERVRQMVGEEVDVIDTTSDELPDAHAR